MQFPDRDGDAIQSGFQFAVQTAVLHLPVAVLHKPPRQHVFPPMPFPKPAVCGYVPVRSILPLSRHRPDRCVVGNAAALSLRVASMFESGFAVAIDHRYVPNLPDRSDVQFQAYLTNVF